MSLYLAPASRGRTRLRALFLVSLGLSLLLEVVIVLVMHGLGVVDAVRVMFTFTPEQLDGVVQSLGVGKNQVADGMLSQFPLDFVLPIFYSTGLFCLLSIALTPKPRGMSHLGTVQRARALDRFRALRAWYGVRWLPLFAGVMDIASNLTQLVIMPAVRNGSSITGLRGSWFEGIPFETLMLLNGIAVVLQFTLIGVSIAVAAGGLIVRFRAYR